MAVRPIITYDNPRLRKKSVKIKRVDADLQSLIDDMIDTMRAAEGIGLAAPQVGVLLRLIVAEYTDDETEEIYQTVLVNPEITSREGEWMAEEGCLSIPGYVGTVPRAERVTVKGRNRTGKDVRIKADGTLAHILQHEIDHLDGVLYIDYLNSPEDLRKVEPGTRRRRRRGGGEEEEPSPPSPESPPPTGAGDDTTSEDRTIGHDDAMADDGTVARGLVARRASGEQGTSVRPGNDASAASTAVPEGEARAGSTESDKRVAGSRGASPASGTGIGAPTDSIDEPRCCSICGHS